MKKKVSSIGVTNTQNEALMKPVEANEVKKAVFKMGADKSPGPDGFSSTFYQSF